jgi:RHS repeat-associated protein
LRVTKSGARIGCTRYYQHSGQAVAMRTLSGVTWLAGDHQGTSRIAIDAATQSFSLRRQDPYGNQRGASTGTAWPAAMDKGLVGGTLDNSGLTHLGAREYDPLIGRFVSADPVVDFNDPVQVQGYAYANHSPVTSSDPDGLRPFDDDIVGGGSGHSPSIGDPQRNNPHSSDAEERRATANSAETHRIRQIRKRQIMEGKFGIRDRLKEMADDAIDQAERAAGGGRSKGLRKLIGQAVEEWTEDMMVEAMIDEALSRIDEGRHDGKNKTEKNEVVAFNDDEFTIAFELAMRGRTVESRDENLKTVGNPDAKVFDAYVDDVRSEFKMVESNNVRRITEIYSNANKQHATRLYMYTKDTVEESTVKEAQAKFHGNAYRRDQTELTEVQVMGEVEAPLQPISSDLNCEGWDWWSGC